MEEVLDDDVLEEKESLGDDLLEEDLDQDDDNDNEEDDNEEGDNEEGDNEEGDNEKDDDDEDGDENDDEEDDDPIPLAIAKVRAGNNSDGNQTLPIEKIQWDEALSVDIPEIDELQKKNFDLLNELIDCRIEGRCAKDSSAMVAKLIDDSRYYFSKEEEFLRRCGYPDINVHSKEHRQFIKSVISVRRQVTEDKKNLSYEVIKTLREWLVAHIMRNDLMYVPFVRTNQYVNECRQKR